MTNLSSLAKFDPECGVSASAGRGGGLLQRSRVACWSCVLVLRAGLACWSCAPVDPGAVSRDRCMACHSSQDRVAGQALGLDQ